MWPEVYPKVIPQVVLVIHLLLSPNNLPIVKSSFFHHISTTNLDGAFYFMYENRHFTGYYSLVLYPVKTSTKGFVKAHMAMHSKLPISSRS